MDQETKNAINKIREIADKHQLAVRIFTRNDISGMIEGTDANDNDVFFDLSDSEWDDVKDSFESGVLDSEWENLDSIARRVCKNSRD